MTGGLRLPGGGGDADALQKQEVQALIDSSDTGSGKYVELAPAGNASQDVSGNLTLGGDKITLNATDGSADFAGGQISLGAFIISGTDVGVVSADQFSVSAPGVNGSTFIQYNEAGTAAVFNISSDGNMRFGSDISDFATTSVTLSADGS